MNYLRNNNTSLNLFPVKIVFLTLVCLLFSSCNAVKKVKENQYLLSENVIYVNGEEFKDRLLYNYIIQQPNQKILGSPLKLHIYNLGRDNADSIYLEKLKNKPKKKRFMRRLLSKKQVNRYAGRKYNFNEWVKKTGEAPVIIEKRKTKKSQKKIEAFFWNRGWFNVETTYDIEVTDSSKARVNYYITTKKPFNITTLTKNIESKDIDSIYKINKKDSKIKVGRQYNTLSLEAERNRITKNLRNNGLYYFERDYIKFDADTIGNFNNVDLRLTINNKKIIDNDSTKFEPFKVRKISKVKIFTDSNFGNSYQKANDTTYYKGYELYSYKELKYKPKAITNAIFLAPNTVYSDSLRTLTYNSISNLGVFKYPTISFKKDPEDSKDESLVATIQLTPRKKYAIGVNFDVSTSTIQDIGLGFAGSLAIRNVFRRAETFEISGRSSFGASQDIAESDKRFFNILEFGVDAKLNFPRIIFPFDTNKLIKKSSAPRTTLNVGFTSQQNIGLDKETVTGAFSYNWKPNKKLSNRFTLFNLQFVRNLRTDNYFNVYRTSYNQINTISKRILPSDSELFGDNGDLKTSSTEPGVNSFLISALNNNFPSLSNNEFIELRNLSERRDRLAEDNLIFSSIYNLIRDTRQNLYDEDFSRFRLKIESVGNVLSSAAQILNSPKNNEDKFKLFNVQFSQFVKLESEYVKHWRIDRKNIIAIRGFGGIAIPYGNSNSIPFSQSYFGGGANDNRAWVAYDLGPGSSSGRNEFNEANLKLAFNAEYRFNIIKDFKGALFADVGNIWNVLDSFEDEEDVTFSGFEDLSELALGTGVGFRYDFSFFVLRLDAAVKMYNPALIKEDRWFTNVRFDKTVYNIGINYPF